MYFELFLKLIIIILYYFMYIGIGKTAFTASLQHFYPDIFTLYGVFYCKYGETKRSNGAQIILSLSLQISNICRPYKQYLFKDNYAQRIVFDIDNMTWRELMYSLIAKPLTSIECIEYFKANDTIGLIIIDAVDEIDKTNNKERKEFLKFLIDFSHSLPQYIRLLITGRPENDIIEAFQPLNPLIISENDPRHIQDLQIYVRTQLKNKLLYKTELNAAVELFMKRSEGKFVYTALVMDQIDGNEVTLESLKNALPNGIYDVSISIVSIMYMYSSIYYLYGNHSSYSIYHLHNILD